MWRLEITFPLLLEAAAKNIWKMSFLGRETPSDVREANIRHKLFTEGKRDNCQMLATAKNKVLKATAYATSLIREFAEPRDVVVYEFVDGRITIRRAQAIHASGAKAPKHLSEMLPE